MPSAPFSWRCDMAQSQNGWCQSREANETAGLDLPWLPRLGLPAQINNQGPCHALGALGHQTRQQNGKRRGLDEDLEETSKVSADGIRAKSGDLTRVNSVPR